MARHRHVTCVRADGLSEVLAALLADRHVTAATLVDLGSGFVLDACTRDDGVADLEVLGAAHADLARAGSLLAPEAPDLVVDTGDGRVHVLRSVADPHGDRLAVTAVVRGNARALLRARRHLAAVPVEALTAGPTLARRPVGGSWDLAPPAPDAPAIAPDDLPGLDPTVPMADVTAWVPSPEPAPWAAAMVPGPADDPSGA